MRCRSAPELRLIEGGKDRPPPPASAFAFVRALARADAERMIADLDRDSVPRK